METLIIKQAFIITCIVVAIWAMMLPDMLFEKIRDIEMPEWLSSPLYSCPICQIPYYGSVAYWVIFHNSWINWIIVILVAMGMATIFVKIKKN